MVTVLINEDIFNNKIVSLIPKKAKTIEFLATDIRGHTIYRDCTRLLVDGVRYDFIDNELIKVDKA